MCIIQVVNGEVIPREVIREETARLRQRPEWRDLPESLESSMGLRQEAELRLIDRVLLRQAVEKDTRPLAPGLVAAAMEGLKSAGGCGDMAGDWALPPEVEWDLRVKRTIEDLMGPIAKVTRAEIAQFYKKERKNFHRAEMIRAAHIVKHVDATHPEEEARAGIEAAMAELQRGEPFARVVERYSDCKGNGGELGFFQRGQMLAEFDEVVFHLKPGQRSPIFRTPLGFHIAEARARVQEGVAPLRDVRPTIEEFLTAMKERDAFRRMLLDLRAKADIRRGPAREAHAAA